MRRVLLIATEPPSSLRSSPAQEILRALTESVGPDIHFSSITPPRTLEAADAIVDAVAASEATHVVVFSNAQAKLELYRQMSNTWPHKPDNNGQRREGEILPGAPRAFVSKSPVAQAWQAWHERSTDFADVTIDSSSDDDVENTIAFRLASALEQPVVRVGVPSIEEGRVAETALFLVDKLTA